MKISLGFILFLLTGWVHAQYVPHHVQSFQFASVYNPAFTGVERVSDLRLSYRHQWTGYGSMAPRFFNASYQMRLSEPPDLEHNALRVSTPMALRESEMPLGKKLITGFGGHIFQSSIGVLQSIGIGVTGSAQYPVSEDVRVSAGLGFILHDQRMDLTDVYLGRDADPDMFFDNLRGGGSGETNLNVRAGVAVYGKNFYAGLSYLPLLNTRIKKSDVTYTQNEYRYAVQAGYSFTVNPSFALRPSVLLLASGDGKDLLDFQVKGFIQERVWAGLSYRTVKAAAAMAGFNFNSFVSGAYAYEFSLGEFQQFTDGSHEIVVGFRFGNIRGRKPYLW